MNNKYKEIKVLLDPGISFEEMQSLNPFQPFSEIICDFLDDLAKGLMKNKENKLYSDIITLAFFCRKGNVKRYKERYQSEIDTRLGRGLTFHIAPSNVPINFAYTMISGLLSGNACIVRASSKEFIQTAIICNEIKRLFENTKYKELKKYIAVIQYPRNNKINDYFSSLCNVRIIWGGDSTITEIRKSPLSSKAYDILFSDRYSFCLINADEYLNKYDEKSVANDFYNDTYLFDQNACTAPRFIYWVGTKEIVQKAKDRFWQNLYDVVKSKYMMADVVAIDKLVTSYSASIAFGNVEISQSIDNLIKRVALDELNIQIPDYRCSGGLFYEYDSQSYEEMVSILDEKYQTLSIIGFDKNDIISFLIGKRVHGIDRVVPVGRTLDFDFIWDGYDLIINMSRIIN